MTCEAGCILTRFTKELVECAMPCICWPEESMLWLRSFLTVCDASGGRSWSSLLPNRSILRSEEGRYTEQYCTAMWMLHHNPHHRQQSHNRRHLPQAEALDSSAIRDRRRRQPFSNLKAIQDHNWRHHENEQNKGPQFHTSRYVSQLTKRVSGWTGHVFMQ